MQNSKHSIFQKLGVFYLIVVLVALIGLNGCENPGSVGAGLTDPGAAVTVDTIAISGIDTTYTNSLAGTRTYFSAGQFDDPIFGKMSVIGMNLPNLPTVQDTIKPDAKMYMRLSLDGNEVYGDTAASQDFDIYQIDEYWQAPNRLVNDDIKINTSNKIASFSVSNKDSMEVQLSQNWYDKYYNYATDPSSTADSVYEHKLGGLALVPSNSNKIIPLKARFTDFAIVNPDSDTVSVGMRKWAYSLDRSNEAYPAGSVPLYSTYERVLNFNLDLSNINIEPSTISKAELIFYQNNSAMTQSLQSKPSSVQRPSEKNIRLHLADPGNVPKDIDPGSPLAQGSYDEQDGAYHMDITTAVQQVLLDKVPEGQKFFVTMSNNGMVSPSLLYTDSDSVPATKRPKIVITYLKNTNK